MYRYTPTRASRVLKLNHTATTCTKLATSAITSHASENIRLEAFDRLNLWSRTLDRSSNSLTTVLIRHKQQDSSTKQNPQSIQVQTSLLTHVSTSPTLKDKPIWDLTPFSPPATQTFLFWLYNRRLPSLFPDTHLPPISRSFAPVKDSPENQQQQHQRSLREAFNLNLIESWRLGALISAPKFQNDILRRVAVLLEREEIGSVRSEDPDYSSVIGWARRAFDGTVDLMGHSEMREFAVDVAARRVYDVGMSGLTLTPADRLNLSTCEQFAGEVFGSLGGQIGTKGVGIQDFAKAYLVEE